MTSDYMDARQGEAMKPSPSPAATVTPSQSDVEAAREWLFKHYGFRNLNVMSHEVDALASLLASRGTRALTEEEKAKLVPLARVADWGGLRDYNSDQLPVEVIVTYPQGKQSSFLKAANLRAFSELFDRLTGEPSA